MPAEFTGENKAGKKCERSERNGVNRSSHNGMPSAAPRRAQRNGVDRSSHNGRPSAALRRAQRRGRAHACFAPRARASFAADCPPTLVSGARLHLAASFHLIRLKFRHKGPARVLDDGRTIGQGHVRLVSCTQQHCYNVPQNRTVHRGMEKRVRAGLMASEESEAPQES